MCVRGFVCVCFSNSSNNTFLTVGGNQIQEDILYNLLQVIVQTSFSSNPSTTQMYDR